MSGDDATASFRGSEGTYENAGAEIDSRVRFMTEQPTDQPISSAIGVPPLAIFIGRPFLDVWTMFVGMPIA